MSTSLTQTEIDQACSALLPSTLLRPLLRDELLDVEGEIERLTDEQIVTLEGLRRNRRALVLGGAGTGKSVLAQHRALKLAEQGFSVLLTCMTTRLATALAANLSHLPGVQVSPFHMLCFEEARAAGVYEALMAEIGTTGRFVAEDALAMAAEINGTKFDAVVVDEGQDFSVEEMASLLFLTGDSTRSIFYVFADARQDSLRNELRTSFNLEASDWEPPFEEPCFELTLNCRNTIQIATVASRIAGDSLPTRGALGPEVRLNQIRDQDSVAQALREVLHRLVIEERIPTHDIIVLCTGTGLRYTGKKFGPVTLGDLADSGEVERGEIAIEEMTTFKGLESSAVVLLVEPGTALQREAAYIGATRARTYLEVIADDTGARALGLR